MPKEYEAKFLEVDVVEIKRKLKEIGATKVHSFKPYRRVVYELCNSAVKGYIRVRDENGKVTMTSKTYADPKFPEENEIVVASSFEDGVNLLSSIGINKKAFHETYREKWTHPDAHEITFDIVPGLPIYTEIDCHTEEQLNKMIETLNLNKYEKRYGAYGDTFMEYYDMTHEEINQNTASLTFDNIANEIKIRKNHKMLEEIAKVYKHIKDKSKFNEMYTEFYNKLGQIKD